MADNADGEAAETGGYGHGGGSGRMRHQGYFSVSGWTAEAGRFISIV